MRLILVRHGRPNEIDPATPGDPSLNEDGRRQARAVARLLAGEGITRIIASPMRRALETAQPLADGVGLGVDIVPGWAEADRGAHRYRSTETLRAEGGEAWARFLADPIRYLGAEPEAFRAPLDATAAGEDRTARVAVFTHGLPVNVVLAHALGLDSVTTFLVGYGSVTRLRRRVEGWGVASVNETAHHRSET